MAYGYVCRLLGEVRGENQEENEHMGDDPPMDQRVPQKAALSHPEGKREREGERERETGRMCV